VLSSAHGFLILIPSQHAATKSAWLTAEVQSRQCRDAGWVHAAGNSYVAVFGAGQSQLESVLLKRKVMGPTWLQLKHPVRTRATSQARSSRKPETEQICVPC